MEQDKKIDAIIIFPAGIMPVAGEKESWRTTTYEESDAFGTLGGRDRVEAAALLAHEYPHAYVVTISHTNGRSNPSLAEIYAKELEELGVERTRILMEEGSNTTQGGVRGSLDLATKKGWKHLMCVSSGFHIPRIEAFFKREQSAILIDYVASETVLEKAHPAFNAHFARIQATPAYQKRLASEAQGLRALAEGMYQVAPAEDKYER